MKLNRKAFWLGYLLGLVLALGLGGGLFYYKFLYQPAIRLADMGLVDLQNRPVASAQWAGQPVIVNYWATWCGPCVAEFPLFEQTARRAGKRVVFVMVSDEPAATIQAFTRKHPYSFIFLRVPKSLPGVNVRPVTYVYDKDKELLQTHSGSVTAEKLATFITDLQEDK
jgi:thiol-disulfide isomerase/thioredoxin